MSEQYTDESGQVYTLPGDLSDEERMQIFRNLAETRREAAVLGREARTQSIEAQLGAQLAKTPAGAPKEFEAPAARFDIARLRTVEGKVKKFQSKFPEANVKTVDDPTGAGQLIAIQLPGQSDFTLLDSEDFLTVSDIAEIGGVVFNLETAGTIISTIATRGKGLIKRLAGQALGGAAGRAADIALEQARGFEKLSLQEAGQDLALSGAMAATGELLFAIPRRVGRAVTGSGFEELTPEELIAERTAIESGIGSLGIAEIHPVARRMLNQAEMSSKEAQNRMLEKFATLLDDMKRLRKEAGDFAGLSDDQLEQFRLGMEEDLLQMVQAGPVDPLKGGRALQAGRQLYVRAAKEHISRKYNTAIAASEGVTFDLTDAINTAKAFKKGVRARGAKPAKPSPDAPVIVEFDKRGALISRSADGKPVRITIEPDGQLAQLLNSLSQLDPKLEAFEGKTAFEQLKELRSQFFDLKNAPIPGAESIEHHIAGQVWDALTQAMDSPIGGDPRFQALYRAASIANRNKEAILEAADLRLIASTSQFDADGLVGQIARPGNGAALRLFARIMPAEQFATFRNSFKSDLIAKPEQIVARLDAFRTDPRALRVMLSPDEENMLRQFGTQMTKLRKGPFVKFLNTGVDLQQRAVRIVDTSDAGQLAQFVERAGGHNSSGGRSLRAAVWQSILDKAETTVRARRVLDMRKAFDAIEKLDKTGKLDVVMRPDEVQLLRNRRELFSLFIGESDVGGGMQVASIAADQAKVFEVLRPAHAIWGAFRGFSAGARNALMGRALTNPTVKTLMSGVGRKPLDFTALRAAAAIAAEVHADLARDPALLK